MLNRWRRLKLWWVTSPGEKSARWWWSTYEGRAGWSAGTLGDEPQRVQGLGTYGGAYQWPGSTGALAQRAGTRCETGVQGISALARRRVSPRRVQSCGEVAYLLWQHGALGTGNVGAHQRPGAPRVFTSKVWGCLGGLVWRQQAGSGAE